MTARDYRAPIRTSSIERKPLLPGYAKKNLITVLDEMYPEISNASVPILVVP
ncbi:MAG: hypothetical protein ACI80V_003445 [Rhodothermales bacterium]|jgi:hypothetical protein